jgi:hypothetical protein
MADPHSLLNGEKFPVSWEFRYPAARVSDRRNSSSHLYFAAIRCISEAELSNFNRLVLIFSMPRAPAREASTEPRRSFARPNASAPLTAGPKPR